MDLNNRTNLLFIFVNEILNDYLGLVNNDFIYRDRYVKDTRKDDIIFMSITDYAKIENLL